MPFDAIFYALRIATAVDYEEGRAYITGHLAGVALTCKQERPPRIGAAVLEPYL